MLIAPERLAARLGIGPGTRILDLGGAAGRLPFANVTVVDLCEPDFECDAFVQLDLVREDLPFEDDAFDVCISSHTFEDLFDPMRALREVQRVGKRGYIETPSRGLESSFHVSAQQGAYPGWGHHHWMFEQTGPATIRITPKGWHLVTHRAQKVMLWYGDPTFSFFWEGGFEIEEAHVTHNGGGHWEEMIAEHNRFVDANRDRCFTEADVEAGKRPPAVVRDGFGYRLAAVPV